MPLHWNDIKTRSHAFSKEPEHEHKSRGRNLGRAFGQARDYFGALKSRGRPRSSHVATFLATRI